MKKFIYFLVACFCLLGFNDLMAQDSKAFRFQAVARDADGNILDAQVLGVKFEIVNLDNSEIVFSETHQVETSALGIFVASLGKGDDQEGTMTSLNWSTENYGLQLYLDLLGGTNYELVGEPSPILSVPHAIYADNANTALDDADKDPSNELQSIIIDGLKIGISNDPNNTELIDISESITNNININDDDSDPLNEIQSLSIDGNNITISGGNTIDLSTILEPLKDDDVDPNNEIQNLTKVGNEIILSNGGSVLDEVDDADADPANELQSLELIGDQLSLKDANGNIQSTVNLPSTSGEGDGDNDPNNELQTWNNLPGIPAGIKDGDDVEDADADPSNEFQSLIVDGLQIGLSNDPNNTQLIDLGQNITNLIENINVNDEDADPSNELQTLDIDGDLLIISQGNSVSLANLPDEVNDEDSNPANELQSLIIDGLEIGLTNDPNNDGLIDLGENIINNLDINDADADPNNEIQSLYIEDNQLVLQNADGSIQNTVNLPEVDETGDGDSDPNNELQNWDNLPGIPADLKDGDDVDDADPDPVNELQTLDIDGDLLIISDGNSISLENITDEVNDADSDPENEIQTIVSSSEQVVTVDPDGIATVTCEHVIGLQDKTGLTTSLITLQDKFEDEDADPSNEIQTLDLDGDLLIISGGNSVNLENLTDEINDADADPENEIQTIVSSSDQIVTIDPDGVPTITCEHVIGLQNNTGLTTSLVTLQDKFKDDDADPENELQTLDIDGDLLIISDGNSVSLENITDEVNDADADPINEIQILSIEGNELSISEGNSITLPTSTGGSTPWLEDGPSVYYPGSVFGADQKVEIKKEEFGDGEIRIYGANGMDNIRLGYEGTNYGAASFRDELGVIKSFIGVSSSNNDGYIYTRGANGLTNISIGAPSINRNIGRIYFHGEDGGSQLDMGVHGSGHAYGVFRGANDGYNVAITRSGTNSDWGAFVLYNEIGEWETVLDIISCGDDASPGGCGRIRTGFIDAFNITANVKNFHMDHPKKEDKEIWYACIEGPEAGAYERGQIQLVNGKAIVNYTDHFKEVINHEGLTISLTPQSADSKGLCAIERTETGFVIRELFNGTGTYKVDWEAKSIRKGYENYEVIRDKKNSPYYDGEENQ